MSAAFTVLHEKMTRGWHMPFKDRIEAGQRLAEALLKYKAQHPVILALPRGGVPVAAEVAAALDAPLDLVLVRKIGLPGQPELAMGAVVDGGHPITVRNEDVIRAAGVSEAEFAAVRNHELAEIERRRTHYIGARARSDVADRVVIVVDDGIATGSTMRAALQALRLRKPKMLILAVPVGPSDTIAEMRGEADVVLCLEIYEFFGAIGVYYGDFRQISDREVIAILAKFPPQPQDAR
jgi:predicted phosphoribosyltransferase